MGTAGDSTLVIFLDFLFIACNFFSTYSDDDKGENGKNMIIMNNSKPKIQI